MNEINLHADYRLALDEIKQRIQATQIRAVLAVNRELLVLYWHIGQTIVSLQQAQGWGGAVVEQMAADLQTEHPGIQGFSRSSLFAMRQFYLFFSPRFEIVPQPVGQLPWGHIRTILGKIKDVDIALFYTSACIENGWSRPILELQIEQGLHLRQGLAPSNFQLVLPAPQSELAQQTLKDPYVFDFLTLSQKAVERDVENQLVTNITRFLLELGKGFAFLGRQYPLEVNSRSYFLDLLFYHTRLKCYVVIELKTGEFKPEYVGKMNFYLSAVDDLLSAEGDQPSIGLILCKDKDRLDVEYALRDVNKPIGVSSFITKEIPLEVQAQLPTVAEIEQQLAGKL
ncbi:MAG: PDDEXK nuclease domain-containing protein [Methylovulum sp.]|nr:PDDEXK nuclease domain-containing protein [Methylovulum sp.]